MNIRSLLFRNDFTAITSGSHITYEDILTSKYKVNELMVPGGGGILAINPKSLIELYQFPEIKFCEFFGEVDLKNIPTSIFGFSILYMKRWKNRPVFSISYVDNVKQVIESLRFLQDDQDEEEL